MELNIKIEREDLIAIIQELMGKKDSAEMTLRDIFPPGEPLPEIKTWPDSPKANIQLFKQTGPRKKSQFGFPDQWIDRAESLINKRVAFTMKDINLESKQSIQAQTNKFKEWLKDKNVEIAKVPTGFGTTTRLVFTPYYYENGVKIMGSDLPPRQKDIIKGGKFRPERIRPTEPEVKSFVESF